MQTAATSPRVTKSRFEATITTWLKNVGEEIEKGEALLRVLVDSAQEEIPSPVSGVVSEIKSFEGSIVRINTVIAVVGASAITLAILASATQASPIRDSESICPTTPGLKPDLRSLDNTTPHVQTLRDELVPLSKMRAIIARRMVESTQISPLVHTVFKVDMARVARCREEQKGRFEQCTGVKLSYMPFIATAAINTLRRFPIVNASLEGGSIRYHGNINLGIAVALDWGLIVPVIKDSEKLSFPLLASAIANVAERARAKRLKPDESSGSTFTLSNSGVYGEEFVTPIINQPDSAILAIGGLRKEPIALSDELGNDIIVVHPIQHFCLGFDHRIIDGSDAGKFMRQFKKTLEEWTIINPLNDPENYHQYCDTVS